MSKTSSVEIGTIVSAQTGRGMVEFSLDGKRAQWDVPKAREILGMLHAAVEAAITDEMLVRFLTEKVGLPKERAVLALRDFRVMRQGSLDTVYPT